MLPSTKSPVLNFRIFSLTKNCYALFVHVYWWSFYQKHCWSRWGKYEFSFAYKYFFYSSTIAYKLRRQILAQLETIWHITVNLLINFAIHWMSIGRQELVGLPLSFSSLYLIMSDERNLMHLLVCCCQLLIGNVLLLSGRGLWGGGAEGIFAFYLCWFSYVFAAFVCWLTLIRMTKDEKVLAFFKGLLL